jgi:prepilin-type N-terminal cleavage/methylation domain-containing protein
MQPNRQRRSRGFTITELLIAVSVMSVVISWVLLAYTDQHKNTLKHERVIEAQHEGRLLADLIIGDLRMGGFMMPTKAGVGSVDGGVGGPDGICMSDPAAVDPATLAGSNQRFSGTRLTGTLGAGVSTVNLDTTEMDVDGNGADDFANPGGILIADGNSVHCGLITNIAGGAITFTPQTPVGFSAGAPQAVAVPALYYDINGTNLRRNGSVLSEQMDDLQIEFWVDADIDGQVDAGEFPLNDLNGFDLSRIRMARIYVTSRTDRADPDFTTGSLPAAANRVAGPVDNFKRRRATVDTLLRNVR